VFARPLQGGYKLFSAILSRRARKTKIKDVLFQKQRRDTLFATYPYFVCCILFFFFCIGKSPASPSYELTAWFR
jgi:hypothetical protein